MDNTYKRKIHNQKKNSQTTLQNSNNLQGGFLSLTQFVNENENSEKREVFA